VLIDGVLGKVTLKDLAGSETEVHSIATIFAENTEAGLPKDQFN
jgi:hypothetical protein